jgi:hypothetical protein
MKTKNTFEGLLFVLVKKPWKTLISKSVRLEISDHEYE